MATGNDVVEGEGVDIAALARERWPRFAALTAPEGSELLELHRAGISPGTLATLYPVEYVEHLPAIFERLRAEPNLVRIFTAVEINAALKTLGFGITTVHFHRLQSAVRDFQARRGPWLSSWSEDSIIGAATWWAYLLVYLFDRAQLIAYPVTNLELVTHAKALRATTGQVCALQPQSS